MEEFSTIASLRSGKYHHRKNVQARPVIQKVEGAND
jgi:hypothetical protein